MTMADSIAVMNAGRIEQQGDPASLYEHPKSVFVANFLGQSNLLRAAIEGPAVDGTMMVSSHGQRLEVDASHIPEGAREIWLGVRPEKLRLGEGGGPNRLHGVVAGTNKVTDEDEENAEKLTSGAAVPTPASPAGNEGRPT